MSLVAPSGASRQLILHPSNPINYQRRTDYRTAAVLLSDTPLWSGLTRASSRPKISRDWTSSCCCCCWDASTQRSAGRCAYSSKHSRTQRKEILTHVIQAGLGREGRTLAHLESWAGEKQHGSYAHFSTAILRRVRSRWNAKVRDGNWGLCFKQVLGLPKNWQVAI